MSRNLGIPQRAGGSGLRGNDSPIRLRDAANTHRTFKTFSSAALPPLPSGSISGSPSFKRHGFLQTFLDVGAVVAAVFVICATAISIPVSIFILLFVRL